MIPTPSLGHLTRSDLRRVYEPAEDSFALLDALEADADALRTSLGTSAPLCVEIGSGSGVITAFLAQILGATAAAYVAIDVNEHANRCTVATGKHNGVRIEAARASLLSALQPRAREKIDVLLFNPPYVPTEEEEEQMAQHDKDIAGAWAGGATGTKLVDALIDHGVIADALAPNGRFYLVAIKQNDPEGIVSRLCSQALQAEVVLKRRAGGEHLHIIRAIKPGSNK
ncbi:s-adenosyl-L-methionine-dependent methyltransferase [Moesziomyces antarcticus]|uniref:Related to MTQ2 - Putative S-adenosylmethionine-dependent methyltransferase n=1 Tax=Pseudozyma antarctica TaxID=84753 RepID=A0A5C3FJS4_PSEA2|nr:s-adenosyl-L-methionine-dependent methyltransferase [Moesziomyces antarcticus]GAK63842.1 s-adenosyl-L-methionine-dependent methyltransferase [Moesziomyces antarcticus]SPO44450.1 related to MTQ2 - Putative S-adenosylmethionine-dependent methyltransferase [Moesziomyces antarcticus]